MTEDTAHEPATEPEAPTAPERLDDAEREALFHAGAHHPDFCDCSAYVIEQAFAEDDCCEALLDTFAAVERIIAQHVARAVAEARAEALRDAADAIQALHPGEVKNSVLFLRDRADREGQS